MHHPACIAFSRMHTTAYYNHCTKGDNVNMTQGCVAAGSTYIFERPEAGEPHHHAVSAAHTHFQRQSCKAPSVPRAHVCLGLYKTQSSGASSLKEGWGHQQQAQAGSSAYVPVYVYGKHEAKYTTSLSKEKTCVNVRMNVRWPSSLPRGTR